MWEVAKPVVEQYILDNVGPRAFFRDLTATYQVLARFGPKLPHLVEQAMARLSEQPPAPAPKPLIGRLGYVALGFVLAGALVIGLRFII